MNKKILIALSVVLVGGAIVFGAFMNKSDKKTKVSSCSEVCSKANNTCPSIIDKNNCENKCVSLSEETKEHLNNSSSCQELTEKPELIADLIIPEINTPDKINSSNDCEMACSNYSIKCLSLVPNASQELYNEGLMSCINECKKWDDNKTGCILSAIDCESMTNVCGL